MLRGSAGPHCSRNFGDLYSGIAIDSCLFFFISVAAWPIRDDDGLFLGS